MIVPDTDKLNKKKCNKGFQAIKAEPVLQGSLKCTAISTDWCFCSRIAIAFGNKAGYDDKLRKNFFLKISYPLPSAVIIKKEKKE